MFINQQGGLGLVAKYVGASTIYTGQLVQISAYFGENRCNVLGATETSGVLWGFAYRDPHSIQRENVAAANASTTSNEHEYITANKRVVVMRGKGWAVSNQLDDDTYHINDALSISTGNNRLKKATAGETTVARITRGGTIASQDILIEFEYNI